MIKITGLSFAYKGYKKLFDNLDTEFLTGHVYGLLGKNGAGKTTLLKIISGLLFPDEGYCNIDGINTFPRDPDFLQKLYIIPEEFDLPPIKINDYVKVNAIFYPEFSYTTFNDIIKEFEVDLNDTLDTLSFGQKKKFLLAFGISTNSKILLMDEPTNGLDIPSKVKFRKIISSNFSEERCFIISTHQVKDLENVIDVITIIENGKIIFNYSVDEISKKLIFKEIENHYELNNSIYTEDIFNKKFGIIKNFDNTEKTKIDLELLFNGVISNHNILNQILKSN